MATNIDPDVLEIMKQIGNHVRKLRLEKTKVPYSDFAKNKIEINKNTYYNIERGEKDYNISWLLKIISHYPDLSISKFFKDAGL